MGRERRRHERVESMLSVRYTSTTGQIAGYSLTKDLSQGGIGLALNGKIPSGTELNLEITLEEEKKAIPAAAKVVWSSRNFEHWRSRYSAGLEFVRIDDKDSDALLEYAQRHRWIKSDFERALEENKVPVLGKEGDFLI